MIKLVELGSTVLRGLYLVSGMDCPGGGGTFGVQLASSVHSW